MTNIWYRSGPSVKKSLSYLIFSNEQIAVFFLLGRCRQKSFLIILPLNSQTPSFEFFIPAIFFS